MATDLGIDLTDHSELFIRQQLAEGRFASTRDVIEAALLLLEEREQKRARWLEAFEQADRPSGEHT